MKNIMAWLIAVGVIGGISCAGAAIRPNPIEGGYTYYYGTAKGNTPDNPDNVYGRLPMTLHDYVPKAGTTNVMYLTCEDAIWTAGNCVFTGTKTYGAEAADDYEYKGSKVSPLFSCKKTNGIRKFMVGDTIGVTAAPGTLQQPEHPLWHFRFTDGGCAAMQSFFIGRSDAFYRTPRSDVYYVVPGTQLWFIRPSDADFAGSPWVDDDGKPLASGYRAENWTWKRENGYDKFTVKTDVAVQVFHLYGKNAAGDIAVDVTVHVVGPDFRFEQLNVRFDGRETQTLRQILGNKGLAVPSCGVKSAVPSDSRMTCVTDGVDAADGCRLTATADFDEDCEVTVTFNDGSLLLLKIVSMPGRMAQMCCANKTPPLISANFKNLIRTKEGQTDGFVWKPYPGTSANTPPGYGHVLYTKGCVAYKGRYYSPCIAGIDPIEVAADKPSPAGQLQCFFSGQKVVGWLEDEDGNKVINPTLCFGNAGFSDLLHWRFGQGPDDTIYNDCTSVIRCDYVGTRVDAEGNFQGMLADECGYYSFFLPRQGEIGQSHDEFTVFLVADAKEIRVTKKVTDLYDDGRKFDFQIVYMNMAKTVVTNYFALANGETRAFSARTDSTVEVTELPSAGYEPKVRRVGDAGFVYGHVINDGGRAEDSEFEFVNGLHPTTLWITDHVDAGGGLMHLAFDPCLGVPSSVLAQWADYVRTNDMMFCSCGGNTRDGASSLERIVGFRDGRGVGDVDKGWVWVTVDANEATNHSSRLWNLVVNDFPVKYSDDLVLASVPEAEIVKKDREGGLVAYVFTNVNDVASLTLGHPAMLRGLLVVGGGGAGGNGTGGGGGGGQVLQANWQVGERLLSPQDIVSVRVGRGGAPSTSSDTSYMGMGKHPGGNGESSWIVIGNEKHEAIGGGGGASDFMDSGSLDAGASGGGGAGGVNGGEPASSVTGHRGGNPRDGYIPGGGGGAGEDGVSAASGAAGKGGEGVFSEITGTKACYGSGGGGGGRNNVTAASGGANAGAGQAAKAGNQGLDGFGGGGGGGGWTDPVCFAGGRGGNGTVVLLLQDIDETLFQVTLETLTYRSARFKLVAYAARGKSMKASFAVSCFEKGGTPPPYVEVATGVPSGETVTYTCVDLEPGKAYTADFKFKNADGEEIRRSVDFSTKTMDFVVKYDDGLICASVESVTREPVGDSWRYVFSDAAETVKMILKQPAAVDRALVVGGGGAGGAGVGGGGGGGQVVSLETPVDLPAWADIRVTVGAGGAASLSDRTGEYEKLKAPGKNGNGSSLTLGDVTSSAIGGGGGASYVTVSLSNAGASGGGASFFRESTQGGGKSASAATGHDGGDAVVKGSTVYAGGGGGAGVKGETGDTVSGFAGRGGAGLSNDITGAAETYGSGGGGGGGSGAKSSSGGTNAGAGQSAKAGNSGLDGFGGGGGGGGMDSNGFYYPGGRGGDGKVIFVLSPLN